VAVFRSYIRSFFMLQFCCLLFTRMPDHDFEDRRLLAAANIPATSSRRVKAGCFAAELTDTSSTRSLFHVSLALDTSRSYAAAKNVDRFLFRKQ
jgi:hypothetical protein